jgi:tetratricopeptide (TPR) repeat protein
VVASPRLAPAQPLPQGMAGRSAPVAGEPDSRSGEPALLAVRCVAAAAQMSELLDLEIYGAPVVQDVRGIAWTYFTDPQPMQEDMRTATVSIAIADRLLAGAGAGEPATERAELLAVQATLCGHGGHFDRSQRLLTAAATVFRRAGERHLLGRTLLRKGMALGNAGQAEPALRLLWRGIELIEPRREPHLLAWATHNLAWFLHEAGRTGQAAACIESARRLYRAARDRRDLARLRWLEGKLAADFATAETALLEARDSLAREGLSYEAALATMDLAVRYAGERQGAKMRKQAQDMRPLFHSEDMYGDTVLALQSFQRHGDNGNPANLLREVNAYLHQTREAQNPAALAAIR